MEKKKNNTPTNHILYSFDQHLLLSRRISWSPPTTSVILTHGLTHGPHCRTSTSAFFGSKEEGPRPWRASRGWPQETRWFSLRSADCGLWAVWADRGGPGLVRCFFIFRTGREGGHMIWRAMISRSFLFQQVASFKAVKVSYSLLQCKTLLRISLVLPSHLKALPCAKNAQKAAS